MCLHKLLYDINIHKDSEKRFKSQQHKNLGKGTNMNHPAKRKLQQNYPVQGGNKLMKIMEGKIRDLRKGTLKCWGCGEEHAL